MDPNFSSFNTNPQHANNSDNKDHISIGSVNITYAPNASGTSAGPPPALPTVAGSSVTIGTLELNAPNSNIIVNMGEPTNAPSCSCSCGRWMLFVARRVFFVARRIVLTARELFL
ncbi:hypothetical protein BDN72DRAFT_851963 [Pluteus cervinus]|uniref:Uncharacterized protein n=1 Tax=Pluteus cervinus TaxID=181527 RepID=A0ACD2ZWM8_9AGAR|nr:hypothetical protein BDN72DRAFT_851963 [Pluteus cervinus]